MKKLGILMALALVSCSQHWNDTIHEEVVAVINALEAEGQSSSMVNGIRREVSLLLPYDSDLSAVKITRFDITEGARCKPDIKVGDILDLSSPLTVTLITYDEYVWTISATLKPKPLSDIYNMNFDQWSQDFLGADVCYGEDADNEQRSVWGSGNTFPALFGMPLLTSETEFVAVEGEGKAAVKLQSRNLEVMEMFAGGCIFTGITEAFSSEEFTAKLGVPCKKRPVTMDGYACYRPGTIDCCKEPHLDKAGSTDNGFVFIALAEWDTPFTASPPAAILDVENIPGIIGYGKAVFDHDMSGYEKFSIELTYLNDHTPKYAVIIATSSSLGDYQTGSSESVLYLDELGFTY